MKGCLRKMSYTLRPPDHFPSGFIARDFAEPSEIAHLAQVLEELADEWLSISSHMMVEVDNEFGDAVLVRWIGKIEVDFNVRVLAHRIRRWCVRESLGI